MPHKTQKASSSSDTIKREVVTTAVAASKTPGIRRRRSIEERLQRAMARQQLIQTQIARLKSEVDGKIRKERNRALTLIGVVVEQCLKEGVFDASPVISRAWWQEQASRLQEKDQDAYRRFLQSLAKTLIA